MLGFVRPAGRRRGTGAGLGAKLAECLFNQTDLLLAKVMLDGAQVEPGDNHGEDREHETGQPIAEEHPATQVRLQERLAPDEQHGRQRQIKGAKPPATRLL